MKADQKNAKKTAMEDTTASRPISISSSEESDYSTADSFNLKEGSFYKLNLPDFRVVGMALPDKKICVFEGCTIPETKDGMDEICASVLFDVWEDSGIIQNLHNGMYRFVRNFTEQEMILAGGIVRADSPSDVWSPVFSD